MTAFALFGQVRPYAWGSRHFIAELQHRPAPSSAPEAELWLGAHPAAPSRLGAESGPSLLDFIAESPSERLGDAVSARFGGELPFLLKVLAAAEPLSLQAHPSAEQAQQGFTREQALGVPLSAETRSYKDTRHKPELIVALTPFTALCGFRAARSTARLFLELGAPELQPYAKRLELDDSALALRSVFEMLMSASPSEQRALSAATHAAVCARAPAAVEFTKELAWAERIGRLYPGDPGLVAALMLNLLELAPYEGLYLPAGNLHAYLDGAGVEIMASSDNVLRGGITKKHVDATELLRILDFRELEPQPLRALASAEGEQVYPAPADEFRLSYFDVSEPVAVPTRGGPEILLVTSGGVELSAEGGTLQLERGAAAFISAATASYRLSGGGIVFRASVP